MKRAWPLVLIPILVVWLAAPREVALPPGSGPVVDASASSEGLPLGAPSVLATRPTSEASLAPVGTAERTAAPTGSGGIGQPASDCKPGYCETPKPPQKLIIPSSGGVSGTATYYCRPGISRCTRGYPFGMYAAAGPELRAMLGDWRGRTVVVIDANGRGVLVQLIDWCACGGDHVIDLYWTAYQGLVNPVTVREQP